MDTRNIEDIYKLSPMQQGMLFHTLYAPQSAVYFEQVMWSVESLNVPSLIRSWQQLLARHPILRTAFFWEGLDEPLQVVHRHIELPLERPDWRELSLGEQQRWLETFLKADRQRGFDLSEVPLMRLTLIRTGDVAYTVVWSYHHLLLDGWSVPLVLDEFRAWYEAFRQGRALDLPEPRPFRDYLAWLRRQDMAGAEAFWRCRLRGFTAPTSISVDRVPGSLPSQSEDYDRQCLTLPTELSEAMQTLARQHRITLNALVLAAWALLLGHYSGETDVMFGLTVHGRPVELPGFETMIGLFINTLPVRLQIPPNNPTLDWLNAVQTELAELRHYEYTPLVQIHGWSDIPRHQPMFDSLLAFESRPSSGSTEQTERFRFFQKTNYPLTASFEPREAFRLHIAYDSRRFDASTINRMLRHFQALLAGIVAQLDVCLADLPLLTAAEWQQLIVEWNDTRVDYPEEWCIHDLFEIQAAQTPDAIAVISQDRHLTYHRLNSRANQLAHHLQALGVGPETVVGLCVARSPEMVVGLLAVLKAGGAYLPLDPTYPAERLTFMLTDAQVTALLTLQPLVDRLPSHGAETVCLDADWPAIARQSDSQPASEVTSDNLAYVIYTSGSTGQPKGVLVPHRGLPNVSAAQQQHFGIAPDERMLQFASLSFDASTFEVLMVLGVGATLCLTDAEHLLPGPDLLHWLADEQVTIFTLTPSALAALPVATLPALRTVTVAGETCPAELVNSWADGRRFYNLYGPTETTIWATAAECQPQDGRPSIGRPIANTQLYLLDGQGQLVPVGVPGELYVGGAGLARGYLDRPALTAECFVPHPFSDELGARLYRTGDLGRYLPDGRIDFLGRIDHQVKVRGFRIELGEVEAALRGYTALRDVAVVAWEGAAGRTDRQLVAYVMPDKGHDLAVSDLRRFLGDKLPTYMVPSAFVTLETLPLTPNGKVDRRALPAPAQRQPELTDAFVPPRSPTEEVLAGIWAQVLRLSQVGVHDDFFALGGHSLLATQVTSRLRQTFQVELPLRSLFEAPTVASLAVQVEAAQRAAQGLSTPPIVPVPRKGPLPLSFAQQRLWFLDQLAPGSPFYNIPSAVRLSGPLSVGALEHGLSKLARRHETLRTTFASADGQPVQVIAPPSSVTLPLVDLSALDAAARETEARRLAGEEAGRPFDLAVGPLWRARLLRLDETEHVLLLNMHHVISDGWSVGVMVREVAALYQALMTGEPSPLTELPIQYADYAIWQREWLQGEVLEKQLSYWKAQLGGDLPVLELPTDRPRPPVQTFCGAVRPFVLAPALIEGLKKLSQRAGVTRFMVLLAAFQTLLHRYSGQAEVVVGSPIANRHHLKTEGLIGFFVNTLALRTDLSGDPTFSELLGRVREVTLGAYAHQDLPFERLVEALRPQRDLSYMPLFQVMFALQNTPRTELTLSDVTLSLIEMDGGVAKFDLTLAVTDEEQRLAGILVYNTDLFDAGTVERLGGHLERLLEGIVADAGQRLSALPLLTAAERQQLLAEWNDACRDYEQQACIHVLFERQVARTPEAVAAVFEGVHVTYARLNRRANRVAHHLRGLGVGPEVRVAICVERSLDMLVGLLGILKAGGAYVPLDPTYPPERLVFIQQDACPSALLIQSQLLDIFAEFSVQAGRGQDQRVICLDADWPLMACQPPDNPCHVAVADNLIYVIYTSGSTGRPKGTLLRHQGLCNFVNAFGHDLGVDRNCRVLQFTSFSFDASTSEIFTALLSGATLHLARRETLLSVPDLVQLLQEESITMAVLPPSMLRELPVEALSTLKIVVSVGEACAPDIVVRWAAGRRFFNGYGPTEATVGSSWEQLDGLLDGATNVSIGRAIANTQIYVLDAHLQPAPIGLPGELCIGSVGLAWGYLKRPDLTAEKFVPNPFNGRHGERMYRTGDLARYRPDGTLEFMGRIDQQVKIRGFRIELGEIETVLVQHPAVRETAVLVRDYAPGDKRLIAYVVPHRGQAFTSGELRDFLKDRLPQYMMPSAFVSLDAMPLTNRGKVNRRALPRPETFEVEDAGGASRLAPRDALEWQLVQIWQELLGVRSVGVRDNFFDLGGHSLLAVRLLARVEQMTEKTLPLTTLFQNATVEHLAMTLRQQHHEANHFSSPLVPLQEGQAGQRPLFLVHPAGGNVLCYVELVRRLGAAQPSYGLQARGLEDGLSPHTSIEDMAREYVALVRQMQAEGPYLLGGWSMGGMVAFEMAQQLHMQGQTVSLLALIDSHAPDGRQKTEAEDLALLVGFALDLGLPLHCLPFTMNGPEQSLTGEQLAGVWQQARQVGVVPPDVELAQIRRLFDVFRSNVQAMGRYVPRAYAGSATLFRASEREGESPLTKDLGWGALVDGELTIHEVPGNHYTMVRLPNVETLANQLGHCLLTIEAAHH